MRAASVPSRPSGRRAFARGAGALLACAALLSLTACQRGAAPAAGATPSPSGYGAVFLGAGECASRGRAAVREVSCRSESAAARVLARHEGSRRDGPACPVPSDFVLHITSATPALDENGDGSVTQGYACMRNLEPPHPGDPGEGGGPRTAVGDCVRAATKGEVCETPCDGTGDEAPGFRVFEAVAVRERCPERTDLYVDVGGAAPVGCARKR